MKKFFVAVVAAIIALCTAICGCVTVQGADGKDGRDLTINDIYESVNAERKAEGLSELTFLDFVKEYLSYDAQELSDAAQLQTVINRSLFSCVSIIVSFGSGNSKSTYAGAGVIVDIDKQNGNASILTNCHVIYNDARYPKISSDVNVYLYGKESYLQTNVRDTAIKAEVVGASITYDLALLKVENSDVIKTSDARAAIFAEDEEVYPGDTVYAIGNPEGKGMSATTGVVSVDSEVVSLNLSDRYPNSSRYFHNYRVIRTDAAVNGGNSGGGLFDSSGRLVGIINSKIESSDIDNIAYALSGSYARRIYALYKDGYGNADITRDAFHLRRAVNEIEYNYVSSSVLDADTGLAKITDKIIVSENLGSFSGDGGLNEGDVLTRIRVLNGTEVVEDVNITRYYNLDDVILSARDGYTIEYTANRSGQEIVRAFTPTFEDCEVSSSIY